MLSSWRTLTARLRTREKQLAAWRPMLRPHVVRRTELLLGLVSAARIAGLVAVAMGCAAAGVGPGVAVVVALAAWVLAAVPCALAKDALLARAFATMSPPAAAGFAPAWSSPPVEVVEVVPRVTKSTVDRDALDFDDAA